MKLYMMKKSSLETIKTNLKTCYAYYYVEDTNDWLKEICGENPFIEIADVDEFELSNLGLSYEKKSKGLVDLENCKIVYSHLKNVISPSQASDERLWAGLCNSTFYKYVKDRWGYNGEIKGSKEKNVNDIMSRFFYARSGTRHSIYRNTLSKCWWIGRNVYDDKNKKNHFWRLDALGANDFSTKISDIFLSNNFASNQQISDGVIGAIAYFNEKEIPLNMKEFLRPSMQLLNALGGTLVLDGLSSEEISDIIIDNINSIREGRESSLNYEETDDEILEEENEDYEME
jgi:hypothetical protein